MSMSYQHTPRTDVSMALEQQLPEKIFSCLKRIYANSCIPIHTLEYTTGNRVILWLNINSFVAKQNKTKNQHNNKLDLAV